MADRIRKFEEDIFYKQDNIQTIEKSRDSASDDDVDIDELMNQLDKDEETNNVMSRYREQRMQEISEHLKKVSKKASEDDNFGKLETITEESKLIKLTSQSNIPVIIHFQLPHFQKCQYMDQELAVLARRYLNSKFVRINVEDCPFLVEKLNIKVLPCVLGYINGLEKTRVVGFSKLGNDPMRFPPIALERLFLSERLIKSNTKNSLSYNAKSGNDSDSDLDI